MAVEFTFCGDWGALSPEAQEVFGRMLQLAYDAAVKGELPGQKKPNPSSSPFLKLAPVSSDCLWRYHVQSAPGGPEIGYVVQVAPFQWRAMLRLRLRGQGKLHTPRRRWLPGAYPSEKAAAGALLTAWQEYRNGSKVNA